MTDVNQLITDHLDIWTSGMEKKSGTGRGNGSTVNLYGINKLKRLIIDLALSGRLVPQVDFEQSQLDHVAAALVRGHTALVEDGKVRRNGKAKIELDRSSNNDTANWFEVTGLALFPTRSGNSKLIKGKQHSEPAPELFPGFSASGQDVWLDGWEWDGDAVVLSAVGARCGKAFPATGKWSAIANTHIAWVMPEVIDPRYALLLLNNEDFWVRSGGAQPFIKTKQTLEAPIQFPSLAEQQRIVAKVDELMALCDALERQAEDSLQAHQTLVETCLATLTNSASPEELTQNWTRIETHFDTLFTTEESIQALEAAIVELGVTGLLLPQNDADESAAELLDRITKDISVYSKMNKVRPVKPTAISEQESRAERLPSGWIETRLSALFRVVTDGDHQAPPRASEGIAFLTIGNISSGQLDFEGCRRVPESYYKGLPAYRTPGLGDILYTVVGATYGRPVLVETDEKFCVQRHIAILKPSEELDVDYLVWLLKSAWVYNQASEGITGSAQPTLALKPLRNFLVFLPPRAEQERISSKIKQLHQITAQLRHSISMSAKTKISLAGTFASKIH